MANTIPTSGTWSYMAGLLNDKNTSVVVTNSTGDRIGEMFQDTTYGLVLRAKDTTDGRLPVTLAGSTVVIGSDNALFKFNGAQEDNFLQLGSPVDIDGELLFPLNATPLNVKIHSETFPSAANVTLSTTYAPLVSGITTKEYQADSSVAEVQFRVTNSSNSSVDIQYYITSNGAAPTPDDEFTATVPGKSGGDNGLLIVSTNDTSTTLVNVGDTVSCQARIVSGSGITVEGSVLATTLKITQNTGIQAAIAAVSQPNPSFEAFSDAPPISVSSDSANPSYVEGLQFASQQGGFELVTTGPWANTGAILNNTGRTLDMLGNFEIYPDNSGSASRIEMWSETSTDGITVTENARSARILEVSNSSESTTTKGSRVTGWNHGEMLRFAMYDSGSGSIDLVQASVTANGTNTVLGSVFFWALATVKAY